VSEVLCQLNNVSFAYRDEPALEDVTLGVEDGAVLAILGPNGGGKTTLLKVILGLVHPQRGSVCVLGRAPEDARGLVGYVPQRAGFDLDFPIRVLDAVLSGRFPARGLLRHFGEPDRNAALRALEDVDMVAFAGRAIGSLSTGQLQRVLIARALAVEPRLLLLDEPTASLDERIGRSIWELLEELSRRMAIVLVSHDIGAISRYVRSVACLNRRLYTHPTRELSPEILEATYGCPVELLAHGHPHRVLAPHGPAGDDQ
jgi:zinc transport system ATP-binding protein